MGTGICVGSREGESIGSSDVSRMDAPEKPMEKNRRARVRRMVLMLAFFIGLYVLSMGPVIRYTQYKNQAGRYKLPGAVLVLYYPLFAATDVAPVLGNWLEEYVKLWLPAE